MAELKTIDPAAGAWVETYRRLVEIVVPRAIAVVSSVDLHGRRNLAPFSFFTVVSSNPPHLAFAPQRAGHSGARKDTLLNIEETGEFVVAAATETIAEQVNACSAMLPRGESEFALSGLTPIPAELVKPALVAESPVNVECELVEIRNYGDEGGAGSLVVGRVLRLHLAEAVLAPDGSIDPAKLAAVGRMGGELWVRTRDTFPMPRP